MNGKLPRGVRLNNPGNIEKGAPWQGLSEDQSGDDRFAVFKAPEWGVRAIARILITYQDKHGIDTVGGIINRWAPPVENDSSSYANHVRQTLKVVKGAAISVHEYGTMRDLVLAIIKHENGMQPYSDDIIDKGLSLAGVEPPKKPLGKSRTIKAASAAGGAVAASTVIQEVATTVQTATPLLQQLLDLSPWILGAIALCAVGYVVYRRIQDDRRMF